MSQRLHIRIGVFPDRPADLIRPEVLLAPRLAWRGQDQCLCATHDIDHPGVC